MQACHQLFLKDSGTGLGKRGPVNLEKMCLLIYPLPPLHDLLQLVNSASIVSP